MDKEDQTPKEFSRDTAIASVHETAISAKVAEARAQVEARFIMAYKRPRDIDEVRIRLLKDCKRPRFAEVARYAKPISGRKPIEGFSIRFAEAAARAFGNVDVSAPILYDDDEKRIVRVGATDLESNVTWNVEVSIPKIVERKKVREGQDVVGTRRTSKGDMNYLVRASDDEMLNKHGSQVSKAARNQVLRLIPGDILDEALEEVNRTLRTDDAVDPDAARKRLIDAFAHQGVKPQEIKELLGHDISSSSEAEMALLRKWYAAMRDGEATWADILREFQPDKKSDTGEAKTRTDKVKAAIAAQAKEKKEKEKEPEPKEEEKAATTDEKPAQSALGFDRETGEVSEDEEPDDVALGLIDQTKEDSE